MRMWTQPSKSVISSHPTIKAAVSFLSLLLIKPLEVQLYTLVFLLVLFDTITGMIVGIKNRRVSSKKWYRSLIKLTNYSILLMIGNATSTVIQIPWLAHMVAMMIITTESISIVENVSIVQPDLIPKRILTVLELLKK
jgi:toxin secretion/phage lysis holin